MAELTFKEPVQYWKWISTRMIALVTEASVYHWMVSSNVPSVMKVFDQHYCMTKGVRIINYEVSPDEKWCLLAGGSANIEAKGIMQLFSIEKQGCQMLEGHAGTFTSLRIAEHSTAIQVLCFVGKKENQSPALHVVEITFLREPSFAFLHDGLQCLPRSIMISLSPFM